LFTSCNATDAILNPEKVNEPLSWGSIYNGNIDLGQNPRYEYQGNARIEKCPALAASKTAQEMVIHPALIIILSLNNLCVNLTYLTDEIDPSIDFSSIYHNERQALPARDAGVPSQFIQAYLVFAFQFIPRDWQARPSHLV
jgi:hypothetical protein